MNAIMYAISPEDVRRHAAEALSRYWPKGHEAILDLPVSQAGGPAPGPLPPALTMVPLPEWAQDLGVDGALLVPAAYADRGDDGAWERIDWWIVAFWYLHGLAEREHERIHGPIHSYSSRLPGWDPRLWERAWVNRTALFLRRWAARCRGRGEADLFGPLPGADLVMTHDVDAVRKTAAIRIKQSTFHGFNAVRLAVRGRLREAVGKIGEAAWFLAGGDGFGTVDAVLEAERRAKVRSRFFVYGGPSSASRGWRRRLMDPGYSVDDAELRRILQAIRSEGHGIGLHPSFGSWADAGALRQEKARLEESLGAPVESCRQHWLRFGWERTWSAQQAAGFRLDSTLGFNDRPGFRTGAALIHRPWDPVAGGPMSIEVLPMILMDSHLHDYLSLEPGERGRQIRRWLGEVIEVGGAAAVLCHPHTLGRDYGWEGTFRDILSLQAGATA